MSVSFDRLAGSYDAARGLPQTALRQIAACIATLAAGTPGARFLEPGVGTGRIALPLLGDDRSYVGIDPCREMLDVLRGKLAAQGSRPIALAQADVRALPFREACFDVVLTAHVLDYVDDWRRALAEIRRVLRPGGRYLHCYEAAEGNALARELQRRWQAITAARGIVGGWPRSTTDAEVLQALREQQATLQLVTAAQWWRRRSLREVLDGYQAAVLPLYPGTPASSIAWAVRDLKAWAAARDEPEDVDVAYRIRFEICLVREWAGRQCRPAGGRRAAL